MKLADRHKPGYALIGFFVVTVLFTWLLWFPALLIQNFDVPLAPPYDLFITLGTFVPSVAGFVFAYIIGGKAELRSLFKSLLNIHIGAKWLHFALFALPAVSAVSCLIFVVTGGSLPPMQFAPWFIPVAFVYIFVLMGPLGEEAGWRGFALKRMLQNSSPLKAAVLLGLIWSTWHLPLFFINGTTQNALIAFDIIPAISGYFLYTLMISILITLLYVMSDGSVFGSMLLHAMGNLSLGVVPLVFSKTGALIVLLVLSVTTIFLVLRYRDAMLPGASQ